MTKKVCECPDRWKAIVAQEQTDKVWHQRMAKNSEFRSGRLALYRHKSSLQCFLYPMMPQSGIMEKAKNIGALVLELRRRARVEFFLPV